MGFGSGHEGGMTKIWNELWQGGGRLVDRLLHFVFCLAAVMVLTAVVHYLLLECWVLYSHTQVGLVWIAEHAESAARIDHIFKLGPRITAVAFPMQLAGAFVAVAVPLRLLWVLRFLYEPHGVWIRTVLWGGGIAWWLAAQLGAPHGLDRATTLPLLLLPTLFLLNPSFSLVVRLLPDPGDLWERRQERKRRQEHGL